jgi:hypothetical protein
MGRGQYFNQRMSAGRTLLDAQGDGNRTCGWIRDHRLRTAHILLLPLFQEKVKGQPFYANGHLETALKLFFKGLVAWHTRFARKKRNKARPSCALRQDVNLGEIIKKRR